MLEANPRQSHNHRQIAGAIIAGGRSKRFGEETKAMADLAGISLIERVYQRLAAQTAKIWLNVPDSLDLPKDIELRGNIQSERVFDTKENSAKSGPLSGVLCTLEAASKNNFEWLLIAPCDTPFIPLDLGQRLLEGCVEKKCKLGIASAEGWNHPSLSLWHTSLLPSLTNAVLAQSKAGFKQYYPDTDHCFIEWATKEYDPFFNINYLEDIETAVDIINNNPHLDPTLNSHVKSSA